MTKGTFTIPTRVYVTAEQRAKLQHLLLETERELDQLLTELLTAHLATRPNPPPPEVTAVGDTVAEELHRRRSELRRLRPRLNDPDNPPPEWLTQMVTDLEAEVHRLEAL